MKRIYLGILVVVGLVLAGCGEFAPTPNETPGLPALSAAELGMAELGVQAGGEPVKAANFLDRKLTFGTTDNNLIVNSVLRHSGFIALVEPLTWDNINSPLFQADATWNVVAPLAEGADESCLSLESVNYPEHYLRHSSSQVRLDPTDSATDAATFEADATWCLRTTFGAGVRSDFVFEAFNSPGYYMRRYDTEVRLSRRDDTQTTDDFTSFDRATAWAALAPMSD